MDKEKEVREKVQALRQFYRNLVNYGAISLFCCLIWLTTGGTFWPLWVLIGFIISATVQAVELGMFPVLEDIFPFFRPDWEERQVQLMMKEVGEKKVDKGDLNKGHFSEEYPEKNTPAHTSYSAKHPDELTEKS